MTYEPAFYILKDDNNYEKISNLKNIEVETLQSEGSFDSISNQFEANFEANLEAIFHLDKEALLKISGIMDMAFELCFNKKVCYLAKHAKKRRARIKNRNRIFRLLEKNKA